MTYALVTQVRAQVPTSFLVPPYRPDIVILSQINNSGALLGLTRPLNLVHQLEFSKVPNQGT